MALPLQASVKKMVYGVEIHWLSNKSKVQDPAGSKEVFWGMKGPITLNFLKKDATLNSPSYCLLHRQNSPYLLNKPCMYLLC